MEKRNTDDLHQALMASPDLDGFLSDNQENFIEENISDSLNKLFSKKNVTKAALAKQSGMSEIYLHQIFAGRRTPSRNRLLCICFGMQVSLEETQELLKSCGLAQLYPKFKRDAIIIYGLVHEATLFETNDKLFEENEETLC
ncbi:MAG: helix-turn-helix transcriptional regulator [Ruminococcaceae bacterium]|nr:helix-turn-helix transcriptional regulator [Oscillospiraceae bacterium]